MHILLLSANAVVSLFFVFSPLTVAAAITPACADNAAGQTVHNHPSDMAQMMHDHPATLTTPPMTTADARAMQQADVDTAAATYSA